METKPTTHLHHTEITLLRFFFSLLKQKKALIIFPFFFALFAVFTTFILPKEYESVSSWVPQSQESNSGFSGLASLAGLNISNTDAESQLLPELITADPIYQKLNSFRFLSNLDSNGITLFEYLELGPKTEEMNPSTKNIFIREAIRHFLEKNVTLEIDQLITLTVISKDAQLSQNLNAFIVREITSLSSQIKTQKITQNRKFLEQQYALYKDSLVKNEEELLVFSEANSYSNSPKLTLERARLLRKIEIFQTISLEMRKQLELTRIEEKKESNLIIFVNEPSLARKPVKPQKKLIVLGAIFLGGIFGLIFATFNLWWNQSGRQELEYIRRLS